MKKEKSIKEQFEKVISTKNISVGEIELELFRIDKKEIWPEVLLLLKEKARESEKTSESKMSLLTLYWLRYDEQTAIKNIPRDGLFLKDLEIPIIIFEEGKKVLGKIKQGNNLKEDLDYLRYIIEGVGDLEIDNVQSLKLLGEIQYCLSGMDKEKDVIQKLNLLVVKALEKRKKQE